MKYRMKTRWLRTNQEGYQFLLLLALVRVRGPSTPHWAHSTLMEPFTHTEQLISLHQNPPWHTARRCDRSHYYNAQITITFQEMTSAYNLCVLTVLGWNETMIYLILWNENTAPHNMGLCQLHYDKNHFNCAMALTSTSSFFSQNEVNNKMLSYSMWHFAIDFIFGKEWNGMLWFFVSDPFFKVQ